MNINSQTLFEQSFDAFSLVTFSLTKFLYTPKCENVTRTGEFRPQMHFYSIFQKSAKCLGFAE